MNGNLTVNAKHGGVETHKSLWLALGLAAFVAVGGMAAGTDSACR